MFFPVVLSQPITQIGELFLIDATKSYFFGELLSAKLDINGVIVNLDIEDKTKWKINFMFNAEGMKQIKLIIESEQEEEFESSTDILVVNKDEERLFSNDQDLARSESEIFCFLSEGQNSFNQYHREAQIRILDQLSNNGIFNKDGNRLLPVDIFDIEEVRDWSKFLTLSIMFRDLSTSNKDLYEEKSVYYFDLARRAQDKAVIRLGQNGERQVGLKQLWMVRR